jgi:hypothetical protein
MKETDRSGLTARGDLGLISRGDEKAAESPPNSPAKRMEFKVYL